MAGPWCSECFSHCNLVQRGFNILSKRLQPMDGVCGINSVEDGSRIAKDSPADYPRIVLGIRHKSC